MDDVYEVDEFLQLSLEEVHYQLEFIFLCISIEEDHLQSAKRILKGVTSQPEDASIDFFRCCKKFSYFIMNQRKCSNDNR